MDDVTAKHAEQLAWILGSWKSIALESSASFENPDAGSGEYSAYEASFSYIETATGQRYYERRTDPEGDLVPRLSRSYTDGSKSALLITKPGNPVRSLTIKRAFGTEDKGQTTRPDPLNHLYFGLEPLSEALGRATSLGKRPASGRDCDLFALSGVDTRVYWLDSETSVPVRVETFADEAARVAGRPLMVWDAVFGDGPGPLGLPMGYQTIRYRPDEGDGTAVSYRVDGKVESITLDETYPESTFWPEITPETAVNDTIGERFISASLPAAEATSTTAADPIRALPRSDPASTLTRALLPLGLVLLIALVIARWWRR